MSLDKSIEHGKEHRKQYRGSKAIDPSCRNHGSCPWCQRNRKHKQTKDIPIDVETDYNDDNEGFDHANRYSNHE